MFGGLYSPRTVPGGALLALARAFTPRVEGSDDLALADLSGLDRLWPSARALAEALGSAATERGLPGLHIALAPTRIAAILTARGRPGTTVVPEREVASVLAPLPVGLLDLPHDARETLERWGITTLGRLAALPPDGLAARLGPDGRRWQRWARGEDDRPFSPAPLPPVFETSLDLDWPITDIGPVSFLLGRVLPPLSAQLERWGCRAASLVVLLRLVNGEIDGRELRTAVPTVDPRTWRTLLLLDLESRPPQEAIQAITVRAIPTPSRRLQHSLLEVAQPDPERLAQTIARLKEWTDRGRAGSPYLLPTHRPGAFVMRGFDPDGPSPACGHTSGVATCGHAEGMAIGLALRARRPPQPVEVRVWGGAPAFIDGGGLHHAVVACAGPWRASGDWWDGAWNREEWDAALAAQPSARPDSKDGLYRLSHELWRGRWFLEGELD